MNSLALQSSRYLEAATRLIYPALCCGCETPLTLYETHICAQCHTSLNNFKIAQSIYGNFPDIPFVDGGWCLYRYEGLIQRILTSVKFHRQFWLLDIFKNALSHLALAVTAEEHYDFIVPIPINRPKYIQRHFNQSEIMSEFISKPTKLRVRKFLKKKWNVLSQSDLGREERLTNVAGAFRATHPSQVKQKSILLIDDILTTGSTVREAAKTLKECGALRVDTIVLAHTPHSGELT